MGILFLFILVVAGTIGVVAGGILGLVAGVVRTGALTWIDLVPGHVAGGAIGLMVGMLIVVRALRDYQRPRR